jgi:regulatory protein
MTQRRARTPSRLDAAALWERALKALGGRAYSTGELRQKLKTRALKPEDVETTLARLKEYGFLDDNKLAERFATSRLESEGFGKRRVSDELRRRRIAPALAASMVEKVYSAVDETTLIEDFILRKYRTTPRASLFHDQKDLAAAYRRLVRAGFSTGSILRVLKRFAANPDLLDDFEPPLEAEGEAS